MSWFSKPRSATDELVDYVLDRIANGPLRSHGFGIYSDAADKDGTGQTYSYHKGAHDTVVIVLSFEQSKTVSDALVRRLIAMAKEQVK